MNSGVVTLALLSIGMFVTGAGHLSGGDNSKFVAFLCYMTGIIFAIGAGLAFERIH